MELHDLVNIALLILAILRLAIPENGRSRDAAHDEQTSCDGALSLEPSKSDAIKINLIGITRPIHIYNPSSSRHCPICPARARETQQSRTNIKLNWCLVSERGRHGQA